MILKVVGLFGYSPLAYFTDIYSLCYISSSFVLYRQEKIRIFLMSSETNGQEQNCFLRIFITFCFMFLYASVTLNFYLLTNKTVTNICAMFLGIINFRFLQGEIIYGYTMLLNINFRLILGVGITRYLEGYIRTLTIISLVFDILLYLYFFQ